MERITKQMLNTYFELVSIQKKNLPKIREQEKRENAFLKENAFFDHLGQRIFVEDRFCLANQDEQERYYKQMPIGDKNDLIIDIRAAKREFYEAHKHAFEFPNNTSYHKKFVSVVFYGKMYMYLYTKYGMLAIYK